MKRAMREILPYKSGIIYHGEFHVALKNNYKHMNYKNNSIQMFLVSK